MDIDFVKLSNNLKFSFDDKELEQLKIDFDIFLKQVDILSKIDTTNVKCMDFPIDITTCYLRDDNNGRLLDKELLLSNVKNKKDDYIIVPRILKD